MSEPPTRHPGLADATTPPFDPLSIFALEDPLPGAGQATALAAVHQPAQRKPLPLDVTGQPLNALEARLGRLTALHEIRPSADETPRSFRAEVAARVTTMRPAPVTERPIPPVDERPLALAEEMVRRLEERVAKSTARLEQMAQAESKLERELDRLQRQAQTLRVSISENAGQLAIARKSSTAYRSFTTSMTAFVKRIGMRGERPCRDLSAHLSTISTPRPTARIRGVRIAYGVLTTLVVGGFSMTRAFVGQPQAGARSWQDARAVGAAGRAALPSVTLTSGMLSITVPEPPPGGVLSAGASPVAALGRSSVDAAQLWRGLEVDADPKLTSKRGAGGALKDSIRKARSESVTVSESAAVREFIGGLAVQSDPPGAIVYIDRQRVGQTPLKLSSVRAGSHVVAIERDGYQRWSRAVLVPADEQTRMSASLQPEQSR